MLKPTPVLLDVFAFCLAVASSRSGVVLHAFTVMSNHWHAVLTDEEGRLPEFAEWLHKYVAKCMNAVLGRTENFWSPAHYNAIPLLDRADVLDKIIYTLANPVTAGLVPHSRLWPGLRSGPESHMEAPRTYDRPRIYFRERGTVPSSACLHVSKPPAFIDLSDEEYAELLDGQLARRESEQRRRVARSGGRFLGLRRLQSVSTDATAVSVEKLFSPIPKVAGRSVRTRRQAIRKLRSFVARYREAMRKFLDGVSDVVFPAGTYWMCRFMGVASEAPG